MLIISNISEMKAWASDTRAHKLEIGFVPTMGYLHDGHLSLTQCARTENERVVVSIFVNPTQFGQNEDLGRYPQDYEGDRRKLENAGVDVLFYPQASEIYGAGFQTFVNVEEISRPLCGISRPGHFRGVATIVLKLLNIVSPDRAYFGQKDFQQLQVIRTMVRDLNVSTEIVSCPIVREPDGLAMSSRNAYLNDSERAQAPVLYESMVLAKMLFGSGETSPEIIQKSIIDRIAREPDASVDYARLVDPTTLEDVKKVQIGTVIALAVKIGKTRLIDNMVLEH